MKLLDWLRTSRRREASETRAAGSGFTAEIMAAREAWISGARGIAELTATAQTCVSMWEHGLALADVDGTDALDRRTLAMLARSLAVRGEALFVIGDDGLVPASDWDLRTRSGRPTAYRVSIPEAGGGSTTTALAGEVLHVIIGADVAAPWCGAAPLRRASLTASLLHELESALGEVYALAPLGSQIVPFPEGRETDLETLGRSFRGRRGRVMLRESVTVSAAGGPAPQVDWRPTSTSPDLRPALPVEMLTAARGAVMGAFGVLPSLLAEAAQGPLVREAQRHLAQRTLAPIAAVIAEEASQKLGGAVSLDCLRPLQAFDAGGRARAVATVVEALARAREAGVDPAAALNLVDWQED